MENQLMTKKDFNIIENRFMKFSDEETFLKEVSFAMGILKGNAYLNRATTESKLECVLNLAMTGLTLNPVLKLAYLIPFSDKGTVKCRVEPSYQGLIKLVTDTASAVTIYSHAVFEGDDFEVSLGTSMNIIHKPKFKSKDIIHVYAVAKLHDGTMQIEVMDAFQIKEIRSNSESFKAFKSGKSRSCIWEDHFGEMAKKTVVKRLIKYLPKTDRWQKLGDAIELDNQDYGATDSQKDYIDGLLMTANLSPELLEDYEREMSYMTSDRAGEMINELLNNQVDPIDAGTAYNQTDIKNKLNE